MKGLKLHIRPAEAGDAESLAAFYKAEHAPLPPRFPEEIVAKMLGSIVAHTGFRVEGDRLRIDYVYIARELRRKRIGRSLLLELERIAIRRNCHSLVVDSGCMIKEYLSGLGFTPAEGGLFKTVGG